MCNPIAVQVGIAAVGAALQLRQQEAQQDAINEAAEDQDQVIREVTAQNLNQLSRQGVEDAEGQATEQEGIRRDVMSREGTAVAMNGATGSTGLSVDAMLQDLAGKGLSAQRISEVNYLRAGMARDDAAQQIVTGARGDLTSLKRAPTGLSGLDYLGAGLQVGAAGANAYYRKGT